MLFRMDGRLLSLNLLSMSNHIVEGSLVKRCVKDQCYNIEARENPVNWLGLKDVAK